MRSRCHDIHLYDRIATTNQTRPCRLIFGLLVMQYRMSYAKHRADGNVSGMMIVDWID
jgi:hypothetical protein